MIESLRKISPVYVFVDLVFIIMSFYGIYILKYNSFNDLFTNINLPNFKEHTYIFTLWTVFLMFFLKRRNLYSTDRSLTIPREFIRTFMSILYSTILVSSVIFFAQYKFFPRFIIMGHFLLLCVTLVIWRIAKRMILRNLISQGFHNFNVLIIGAGDAGREVLKESKRVSFWGLRVMGFLDDTKTGYVEGVPILGEIREFMSLAKKFFVDEVIIALPSESKVVAKLINEAKCMHLGIRILPETIGVPLSILNISYLGILPLLTYKERIVHPSELILKRIFDSFVCLVLLILFSPLFLIISILIKLDSPGPIFYIHKRTGMKGRVFNFYKFRSMIAEADNLKAGLLENNEIHGGVIFKIKNDPRITRIGWILRKYSLDEIPQLFNVLKGDMSLVGPRPFIVEESCNLCPDHIPRLNIRPGVTGLSQIRGRSDLSLNRWMKWDLWYLDNWSFKLDLAILWLTVPAVLKKKGAY